jgi:hypothetical protein
MIRVVSTSMRDRVSACATAALCGAVVLTSCGGSGGPTAPTPSFVRGTETAAATGFAQHTTFCVEFNNARAGEVSAYVTPPWIHLQLGAGTCAAPGQVLAERDGDVTADAPAGWNHVTLSNPSDSSTNYTLNLTHWY